jgi:hypothetical protein
MEAIELFEILHKKCQEPNIKCATCDVKAICQAIDMPTQVWDIEKMRTLILQLENKERII